MEIDLDNLVGAESAKTIRGRLAEARRAIAEEAGFVGRDAKLNMAEIGSACDGLIPMDKFWGKTGPTAAAHEFLRWKDEYFLSQYPDRLTDVMSVFYDDVLDLGDGNNDREKNTIHTLRTHLEQAMRRSVTAETISEIRHPAISVMAAFPKGDKRLQVIEEMTQLSMFVALRMPRPGEEPEAGTAAPSP